MKKLYKAIRSVSAGFTIIEMLTVSVVIAAMTISLIHTFSSNKADLGKSARLLIADIRRIQGYATSGKAIEVGGVQTLRCGFGIHYVDSGTITVYAGPNSNTVDCNGATMNRNYNLAEGDMDLETITLQDSDVEIMSQFADVFFESPDPKTYLCPPPSVGVNCRTGSPPRCQAGCTFPAIGAVATHRVTIILRSKGTVTCNLRACRYIDVYPTGKIEIR